MPSRCVGSFHSPLQKLAASPAVSRRRARSCRPTEGRGRLGGRLRPLPRPARGRLGAPPKGVDRVRASPHHVAHPAPLSLDHQQELLDASVREAEARSSRCWDHEPATCRVWDPSVACDQHLTLWRTQRRTSHEPTEAPPAPWTGGAGERAPRAAHTRPSPPTALPPRPHVGTIFLPFSQAQLRVRVRAGLLLWRRAGPGDLRVHSASLRCAGARTRAALRGRPRRPRSPLRLTPKYPNPNFNPNPNPNQEPAARRAAPAACAERAEREERAMPRPARALHGGTWPPWATRGG